MDFVEPTEEDIRIYMTAYVFYKSKTNTRLLLIRKQLTKYVIASTYMNADILLISGQVFFITGDNNTLKCLMKNNEQYYVLDNHGIRSIEPVAKIGLIEMAEMEYVYMAISANLGNTIYIPEMSKLIYFNETCENNAWNHNLFKLGDRIIKLFCDNDGNIIVLNDLGESVSYYTIECPGEQFCRTVDNDKMYLDIQYAASNSAVPYVVHYTAKTGGHTKAALCLAELSTE